MLCLADRGFRGHSRWVAARATGAQLLWRASTTQALAVQTLLPDNSFLSQLAPGAGTRQARRDQAVTVRVIDYELLNAAGEMSVYRLVTSLMDHAAAPAQELARLYHERWQVEAVFDEMKTHLSRSRRVLRSKTPDLVRQEFYGWVMAHYAVRWLLHQGVSRHKLKHAEQSFVAHLNALRVNQPQSGAFPPLNPRRRQRWFEQPLAQCAKLKAIRTVNKRSPRMVKRRHSPPTQALAGKHYESSPLNSIWLSRRLSGSYTSIRIYIAIPIKRTVLRPDSTPYPSLP